MNETLVTIGKRWSCRTFSGELLADDELRAIALAAVQSPSAMNSQRWRIIMVKNKDLIADMDATAVQYFKNRGIESMVKLIAARGDTAFGSAEAIAVVVTNPEGSFTNVELDAGIVAENIALAATSLDIANCISLMVGTIFDTDKAAEYTARLGIPEGFGFSIAVLLGHATGMGTPHEPDTNKISYV